jgi:DNA-binding NtrC family response regulator
MPNQLTADRPILIVDDDPSQRNLLESFLASQGLAVCSARSAEDALEQLASQRPALIISDVRMPGLSGLDLLRRLREEQPLLPVLLVTAYVDIRDAVAAMRDGAVNYLEKPIDLDELLDSVRNALGLSRDVQAAVAPVQRLPEGFIAKSPQMFEVLREVALVAPCDTRVLITGESGAGKELIANTIHAWSARSGQSFVKVNCAAIPETLLESELFGHEKGAFTGAYTRRIGHFEQANGGTILLDEIAEMSPALQSKLLRVTQDGRLQRIGSNEPLETDVRILASTNRDLEGEMLEGRFREDLFYRLNVMEIYVPPLRDRRQDILPLATHFAAQFGKGRVRFSPGAISCLELYDWPGNVRELRNTIERASLLARGEVILPEHFPSRVRGATTDEETETRDGSERRRMDEIMRASILAALREHDYNRTETARALGISRRALTYKIRAYREQGYDVDSPG